MLKLRKILLCNYVYICLFVLVLLITFIRLSIPNKSKYNEDSKIFIGTVYKIVDGSDRKTLYIKNKGSVIARGKIDGKIKLGDKVLVEGDFIKPNRNTTKYLFNYRKYLERKNIYYLVEIKSLKKIRSTKNIYYLYKQKLIDYLDNNPYLFAFILGDKEKISDSVLRSYQENGISHLFAISGMHITLLASILEKILKRFRVSLINIFKITSIFLFIYLLLVGFSPSIVRGVLFYICFKLNSIYYFYIKPINLFIAILSISLIINPNYIYDVGFWYSYLISFSLIVQSSFISSSNYFRGLFKVSLLSFIVSTPITIYNFYQINLLSIIYNLFFVPLISLIIFPVALLSLFIKPCVVILNVFVVVLENLSLFVSNINCFKFIFMRVPVIIYIIYLVIIIVYLVRKKTVCLYVLLFLLIIHYSLPYFDRSNYVKVLDVSQGDSILIHSHNKNILVDTGGGSVYKDNDGEIFFNILSPTFKSLGIKRLDKIVLTHGDKDHLGEALTLIENMDVGQIIINSNRVNYYEKKLLGKKTIIGTRGLSFKINEIGFIQLNKNLIEENDSSQIYLLVFKDIKILLTGDASIRSEEFLLDNYNLKNIDILKVGHHGSDTSSGKEFIESINPKDCLISVGKNNKFGHPKQSVLNTLEKCNIYRTDLDGSIEIKLNKKGYKIRSYTS